MFSIKQDLVETSSRYDADTMPNIDRSDTRKDRRRAAKIGSERGNRTKKVIFNFKSIFIVSFFLYNCKKVIVHKYHA